ncbi:HBS1-like protein [Ananas comosus]|uniref:HBS1-like protein n=1 Tax=Ananas comosus TaxID=4615 RepID=A0A199V6N5_ANACO|nr:HBS1-like protein [Ananas comosus]
MKRSVRKCIGSAPFAPLIMKKVQFSVIYVVSFENPLSNLARMEAKYCVIICIGMTLILMFYAVNGTSVGSGTSIMDKSLPSKMSTTMPNTVPADGIESKKVSSSSEKVIDFVQSGSLRTSSSIDRNKKAPVAHQESEVRPSSSQSKTFQQKVDKNTRSSSTSNEGTSEIVSSSLSQLSLRKNRTIVTKANSHDQYKPEKWMLLDQEQGTLNQLNLAIVGHVDSGKSTLSGRLLHLLGRISKKEMHKNEKEAKEKGKGSFAYAWAMDESTEERERGVTMTVSVAYFDSKKYRVVLLDSPGHKDFVPNMISGATQADAAILVVDACTGSFEAGMDGYGVGQTKEHAQLVRSFGVEQIIVAVNKMDVVGYSKERFDFIKSHLGGFLRTCGFKDSSIIWVPLSAIENQNLITPASDVRLSSWHRGLCLLDAIDSLLPPTRDVSKPLILPICDVIRLQSMGQLAACGKLETGAIRNGSKVLVMPAGEVATVRSIERDSNTCNIARAGDNVAVNLQGIDWSYVMPGGVLCHPDFPVSVATSLELKIVVLDIVTPILVGSQVEFHIHHAKEAARVTKIVSLLDQKTGKVSKSAPRVLKSKQNAVIVVALEGAVCVQEYSTCRALGRAFLRSSGNTIAVGIVTRIIE